VGMDAFGAKSAGNIEFIDLPLEDDELECGEAFGSLESAKWVGGLLMRVGGTVIEVNEVSKMTLDFYQKTLMARGGSLRSNHPI